MSKFRDSFEHFRNGTATETEKEQILEEIDKHEVIEVYLSEQLDEMITPAPEAADESAGKRIARKVRLKIFGMVLTMMLVIVSIAAAAVFLCNQYYYNPNKGIQEVQGGDGQLLMDMIAFTELHSPGYRASMAKAGGMARVVIRCGFNKIIY